MSPGTLANRDTSGAQQGQAPGAEGTLDTPRSAKKLDDYSEEEVADFLRDVVKLDSGTVSRLEGVDGTTLVYMAEQSLQDLWEVYEIDRKKAVKIRAHIHSKRQPGRPHSSSPLALTNVVSSEPYVLQSEEPHRFIEKILANQYVKGAAILREALQNAEDACATEMHITLDLRQHPAEMLLQGNDLHRYQGPALVLTNDSRFTGEDFDSFKRMYSSGKAAKPDSIGKYGLGSRSFFHITDKIFLLSSETLVVVGPSNGMRYSVQELQHYGDQLEPFQDFESMYPVSTVFRLPLRTAEMEQTSPIKAPAYSDSDAEEMIEKFRRGLERDLLFLRHVRRITAERWDAEGQRERLFCVSVAATPPAELGALSSFLQGKTYEELQEDLQEKAKDPPSAEYDALVQVEGDEQASVRWHVSQRLCTDKKLLDLMASVMCPPLIGVALPEGPKPQDGHACHLPYSVRTGLPVHLHAAFALSEDRRSLWKHEEDMQGESLRKPLWNNELQRALAGIYKDMLEGFVEDARYYELWPDEDRVVPDWHAVVDELRALQRDSECLWSPGPLHPGKRRVKPRAATVLSRDFGEIRETALSIAAGVVEVPPSIEAFFRADLRFLGYEQFFETCVFPASRWRGLSSEQKDALLKHLLTRVAQSPPQAQAEYSSLLVRWGVPELERGFPTRGSDRRSLTSLFDPTKELADLVGDESKLLSADFAREEFLPTLRQLGLGSELDLEMITAVARATAEEQDRDRAQLLVRYLDRQGPEDLFDEDPLELFEDISWVPAHDGWLPPNKAVFDAKARDLAGYTDAIRPLLCQLKVRLCDFPQDVQKALLRLQQGDLQELDRQVACRVLREADASSEAHGDHALELLGFLVKQLEAEAEDLEGVPLLRLESGELTRFDRAQRRFFSSDFFKLQPRSPERFLHHDIEKAVEDPHSLPGWTKFGIEDVRPEGILQPDQLAQLESTGAVASTEELLALVLSLLDFIDKEDGYAELCSETWPSLPLIPAETEILRFREDPPIVDLSTCRDEQWQMAVLKDFFRRIGCATLREHPGIPERARTELCADAPRLAKYLRGKVKPPGSDMELSERERDALGSFLLSMPSFALDFLWLPVFPVRGEHIAPREKIWVESEALAGLLRPYGVQLLADAEDFDLGKYLETDAPSAALKRAEPSIQKAGGLHRRDLEELLAFAAESLSPQERRDLADLKLLPDGQRLRDKFRRADPLVQELSPLLEEALLPSDVEQLLSPELRELLRVPGTAEHLDDLLKSVAERLEEVPRPESYQEELLEKLDRMPQAEIDGLFERLGFRDRRVIAVRQPDGLRWCRPRDVFVGRAKQLVGLTAEPTLGHCPRAAEKLFALAPRVELVAEQLRLLCGAAPPAREEDFRPVYEYLDERLRRDGTLPELREPLGRLRRVRCLLRGDGELEYPHLVCRELAAEDCAPFVPVPPLLRNFDALLSELQVRERPPRVLSDGRRLEDLREALFRDLAHTDLELVAQDGSVRAHRCVVFRESPGAAQLASNMGDVYKIDLRDHGLTKHEADFMKEYIYRNRIRKSVVTLDNAERLGRLAQDLQLAYLQDYLDLFSAPWSSSL